MSDDIVPAYAPAFKEKYKEQLQKRACKAEAIELAKERHLDTWLSKFEGMTKKRVWESLPGTVGKPSLSSFYAQLQSYENLESYLRRQFELQIYRLFSTEIQDEEISTLLRMAK